MKPLPREPEQVVFSGGGLRCFWQGGVMDELCRHRRIRPDRVTGVSGGAAAAAAFLAQCEDALLENMCAAFAETDHNIDLSAPGEDGFTPHQRIYRQVIARTFPDAAARRVAEGARLQILIAHPPRHGGSKLTGTAMAAAYEAELHLVGSPHFHWAQKMGLDPRMVDANRAAREGTLVDLICAAAVIPPVFEPPLWEGRPVVDGGMADQAPLPDPNEGRTLVLLTRRYDRLPEVEDRVYVWPSEETPADKIDFTDPAKLRRTWEQGAEDARGWLRAEDRS